MQLEL